MSPPGPYGRSRAGARDPAQAGTDIPGSTQDITAAEAERRIRRLNSLYNALSRSNEAMFRESDPRKLCNAVCQIAVVEGGLVSATVRLHDPDRKALMPYCGYGPLRGWIGELMIPLNEPRSRAAWSARNLKPYFSDDISTDPLVAVAREDAEHVGVRSSGGLPLAIEGELVGLLSVYAAEPYYFDEEMTRLLEGLARNLSFAFSKNRAESALRRSEESYRNLFNSLPQAVRVLVDEKVVLLNPAGQTMFGRPGQSAIGDSAFDCLDPELREAGRARLRQVIDGRVISPAREMQVVRSDGSRIPVELTLLPIEFEGKPAALSIGQDLVARKQVERRVLRLTSLYAALSRSNEAIFRLTDLKTLCQAVCEIAVVHGGLLSASVRLLSRDGTLLEYFAGHGKLLGRIGVAPIPVDSQNANPARVLRERRARFSNRFTEDPATAAAHDDARTMGVRSGAALPLIDNGSAVGVMSVFSAEPDFFDHELVGLLEEMARNLSFAFAREKTAAALAVTEARYRALFESSPDAITVIENGKVVLLNPAGVRLLGVKSAEEVIGRPAFGAVAPEHREISRLRIEEVMRDKRAAPPMEMKVLRADGTSVLVEAAALPFEYEGRPAVLSYLRDLTERHAAERRIGRLTSLYAALSRTNEAIFRMGDLRTLCQAVCEIAVVDGGLASAAIRLLDRDTGMIVPYCGHGPLLGRVGAVAIPLDSPTSNVARTLREGMLYISNDFQHDPRTKEVWADAERLDMRAAAVLPLIDEDRGIGVLSVFAAEAGFFDPELVKLLQEMALNLSSAFTRHQAAVALTKSEARYRALVDSSPDAIAIICDGNIVMLNPSGERLFGASSPEQVIGMPVVETLPTQYRDMAVSRLLTVAQTGVAARPVEYELLRLDGGRVTVEAVALPFEYEGRPAVLSFLRDLTLRKQAEQRINRLTSLYAALSRTNEAIFRHTDLRELCQAVCEIAVKDGGLVSAAIRAYDPGSRKLMPFVGYGPLSGRLGADVIDIDDPGSNAAMIARNGGHYVCNDIAEDPRAKASKRDGEKIGVQASAGFALSDDGALAGTLSVFAAETGYFDVEMIGLLDELSRNLSFAFSRQRSAANLKKSEERYRMLFNAAPDAMRVVCDGRIVMLNPAGARLLGFANAEQAIGKPLEYTIAPADRAAAIERVRIVIEERRALPAAEQGLMKLDGTVIEAEVISLPFDFEGRPAALTIAHDLTERKAAERAIQQVHAELEDRVQRRTEELKLALSDLEAFSYTVAHDLRAPLRRMSGFASLLRENIGGRVDEENGMFIERISDGVQTMDRLIEGLLELAQLGRAKLKPMQVDLTAEARAIAASLIAREPERQVEFIIAENLHAWADPRFIRDVLDNLMGNAWKFTSAHATARIEFGTLGPGNVREGGRSEGADPNDSATDDEYIYFVRDDGAGFDPSYAAKLFGTFQRLHAQHEFAGTGIGLASVKRIITHHGGRVWAQGAPEEGATIYFTLPLIPVQ